MPIETLTREEIEALVRRIFEEAQQSQAPAVMTTAAAAKYAGMVLGNPRTPKTIRTWIRNGLMAELRGNETASRRRTSTNFSPAAGSGSRRLMPSSHL